MADISKLNVNNTTYDIKDDDAEAALVELVDGGAKNIMENVAVSQTISSVNFTINADKTVTADGTATSAAWLVLSENKTLKAGTYVISGGTTSVRVVVSPDKVSANIIAQSAGSPAEFTLENDTDSLLFAVRMSTNAGANNVTVYPMICTKAAWEISQKFVPYRPSWDEKQDVLTFDTTPTGGSTNPVTSGGVKTDQDRQDALEAADRAALVGLVDGGAKNLLRFDGISNITGSTTVDFTYNADGSVTIDGNSGDTSAYVFLRYSGVNLDIIQFADGEHIISGVPTGAVGLDMRCTAGATVYGLDTGAGAVIKDATGESAVRIIIRVAAGTTLSNVTVRPMICTKAAWDISQKYVPYRPTYDELIARIEALENT